MKLNWLKDVTPVEVSYVDKPAIDRRFIFLKREGAKGALPLKATKPFLSNVGDLIKQKFGFVDTKIGRVLSKSNETSLLKAIDSMMKAGENIQNVLSKIRKKSKEEEMNEKEIKELIEKSINTKIDEKLKAFEESFEAKLKKLLFEDGKKEEEEKEEVKVKPKTEKGKEEEGKEEKEEEEKKKETIGEKSVEGSLLTKVLKAIKDPLEKIGSRFDVIEKELNIKPKSDKKKVGKKDLEEKTEEGDVSFEGVFQFKDI